MSTKPKRTQSGTSRSDLLLSSHVGENAELFAQILALHVPAGSLVADVTYGLGAFWKKVPADTYRVLASDIALKPGLRAPPGFTLTGDIDCRALPHTAASLDALVLDPPYMEGFYRERAEQLAGSGTHTSFQHAYSSGTATTIEGARWHEAVVAMYAKSCQEAMRVLRPGGVLIVKCQDEVSGGKQHLSHVEIITGCESLRFYCTDLFVLTRTNRPGVSRVETPVHARKNHSYFLVFAKPRTNRRRAHSSSRSWCTG